MAHIEQARRERNLIRRDALLRQAESVASDLIHKTHAKFTDPFYRFLRGMVELAAGNDEKAWDLFQKAAMTRAAQFQRYEGFPLRNAIGDAAVEASLHLATKRIVSGKFDEADKIVARTAPLVAKNNPNRALFERIAGITAGRLGRCDEAAAHFETSIELAGDPGFANELHAILATMYFDQDQLDKGDEVLAKIPADSKHPEVIYARCTSVYKRALAEPDGPRMDEALRLYRDVMKTYPENEVYHLVEQWGDLVLAHVSKDEADAQRELLLETVALCEREVKRRPECPSLYLKLQTLHELLGNEEEAKRYAELYAVKKKDWANKIRFDANGKPRGH
jgi:tetratricopeptide (TPR) repeat protein